MKPLLARGDLIGVVATGFAVQSKPLESGLAFLRRRGYRVKAGAHLSATDGYLAGTDDQRLEDLQGMLRDPDVNAVWFARGGFGTARLLGRIDWRGIRRAPKLLIGYSDLTALFAPVLRRSSSLCLYGPGVEELGDARKYRRDWLNRILRGETASLRVRRRDVLVEGRAAGALVGGNLAVLSHLMGTRFAPDLAGKVLFLEEVGEETYRIDRMLTQLRHAARLERLAGVVLGAFVDHRRKRAFPADRSLDAVLRETFAPLGIPVVGGLPAGHVDRKLTLPLGARVTIDTSSLRLEFEARRAS